MEKHLKKAACVVFFVISFFVINEKLTELRETPAQIFNVIKEFARQQNEEFGSSTTPRAPENHAYKTREQLYEERRKVVSDGCKKLNMTVSERNDLENSNLVVDKLHSIYYCPIAKISSTFWKRVLTVMASKGKLNSPFEITLAGVRLYKLNKLSKDDVNILRNNGTSFMIVRDPYARLFSGYENKIYHPTLWAWKSIGRQIVHVVRDNHDDIYKNVGFDVTFPEFIKYILYLSDSGRGINKHFSPMLNRCNPCSTNFQFIGKLETLSEDADYLISKWRNQFDDVNLHFEDFEKETTLDTLRAHVKFLFGTKKVLAKIKFPFIKVMLRTWRDLQIRGMLSKHIAFPFKEADADSVTKEDYTEAVKKALNIPMDRTEVKLQREEAVVQAYRQVSLEDMERLRKFVLQDCLLFGYDDRPAKLFDRSNQISSDFVYLDGLKK